MPKMSDRNRKRRKMAVKLPGGKTVLRYLSRKPGKAKCAETGEELHGIPREDPVRMKRLPKTAKRPERPYGGVLSSKAMRSKFRMEARMNSDDAGKQTGNVAEVGRLCVKLAGRDAGLNCVIVEIIDDNFVTIDGQTRRRKCNINHLEPLNKVLKLKKGASTSDVKKEFDKLGIEMRSASKPKKTAAKPKKEKPKKTSKKAPSKKEEKVEKKETTKKTTKKPAKKATAPTKKSE